MTNCPTNTVCCNIVLGKQRHGLSVSACIMDMDREYAKYVVTLHSGLPHAIKQNDHQTSSPLAFDELSESTACLVLSCPLLISLLCTSVPFCTVAFLLFVFLPFRSLCSYMARFSGVSVNTCSILPLSHTCRLYRLVQMMVETKVTKMRTLYCIRQADRVEQVASFEILTL